MKAWLALAVTLPLLAVGSGTVATARTSLPQPQNGLIAVSGPEGISVVDPRSGKVRALPKTAEMGFPAWSPDGSMLAVTAVDLETSSSSVYTMKADGSERRLVLEHAFAPSWSPDGRQLVVVRESTADVDQPDNELVIVNADGSEQRTLHLDGVDGMLSGPAWSPDGKLIAFVDLGDETIRFVSPDGKAASKPVVAASAPSWSPDSTRIAYGRFVEAKDGGRAVSVVLDLATGRETVLTGEELDAGSPTWSPDGDQLAFLSVDLTRSSKQHVVSQLWVMDADGANARRVAGGEFYGPASWARAVQTTAKPTDEVPVPQPDTTPPGVRDESSSTTKPAKPDVAPAPKPAPKPVPLARKAAPTGAIAVRGSNAIYLVDPDGAAVHKVPDTADMIAPAWSPDGSLLAVERVGKDGSSSIYTIRPDGTQPQVVLKNASAPKWSPTGDRIFVVRNECSTPCEPEDDEANVRYSVRPDGSDLARIDLEQGGVDDPRELAWRGDGSPIWFFEDESLDGPGTFDTAAAAWSPDESRIAFIGALGPTDDEASVDTITAGLWIVSAEGGTPQLLLKGASGWPSWPSAGR